MKKEKNKNFPLDILDLALKEDIQYHGYDYFEDIFLVHNTIPPVAFDEIDLSIDFLGKKIQYPIIFASLTGGHEDLAKFNGKLAEWAKKYQIAMGTGDQFYGMKNQKIANSYAIVRKTYPNGLILGNLSAMNVLDPSFTAQTFQNCIDMIQADAIELYLNPVQLSLWSENPPALGNIFDKLPSLISSTKTPIIIKSMGTGIANEELRKFWDLGITHFDIQGVGGTSFARLETVRDLPLVEKQSGDTVFGPFDFWGIPTLWSLLDLSLRPENQGIPLIVGGGIRNGVQAIKALALGANIISLGYPVLIQLIEDFGHPDEENLKTWLDKFIREMKMAMYFMGAKNLEELREISRSRIIISGKTRTFLEERGIKFPNQKANK